jgi:hypothetical protein
MRTPQARHLCPICLREAKPTRGGNIYAHCDTNTIERATCPGSGQPWHITTTHTPEYQQVTN